MAEVDKDLAFQYEWHREQRNQHVAAMNEIAAKLKEAAGEDETLTVNGKETFTYHYINRYSDTAFRKEEPQLAEEFTVERTTLVIDWAKIKRLSPSLARRFQTRQFKVAGE